MLDTPSAAASLTSTKALYTHIIYTVVLVSQTLTSCCPLNIMTNNEGPRTQSVILSLLCKLLNFQKNKSHSKSTLMNKKRFFSHCDSNLKHAQTEIK